MEKNLVDFGGAVAAVKSEKRVARHGWNGKNMYVYLNKGSRDIQETDKREHSQFINGIDKNLFESGHEGTITRMPNLNMKAADGSTVTGWLASQTDILAEDWVILD